MRRRSILLGVAAAALISGAAQAQQSQRVQIGVLECRGGATIRKVGIDLGITEQSTLTWAVFAPVERAGIGDLSGNYAGAQGSANIGIGLGANVLIGGSANSIALQPLSVQGSTGISVAVGLAGLELRPGR